MEVPEIYDGTVVIKAAVRAPGERAKVAVYSRERDVDPVGACVGMKGSRVQAIIRELRGEKIDIIEYSDDLVTFAQSALAPAKITRVSVHHTGETPHLDVIVEDEQLSLAIGKRGQNVRLAAELIGCRIDIKSESDVKDEVADALARMLQGAFTQERRTVSLTDELDLTTVPGVGAKTAVDLAGAGFNTIQALLDASVEDLQRVEGVGPKTAQSILNWAQEQATHVETGAEAGVEEPAAPEEAAPALQDDSFLAALSRAFKESEERSRLADQMTAEAEADAAAQQAAELASEGGGEGEEPRG
jgi:N utilization substance protein A